MKYLPLCLAMGVCPDEPRSFFMQQYRWCMGSCTLVLQRNFWRSDISSIHKLCFMNGMLFYLASALVGAAVLGDQYPARLPYGGPLYRSLPHGSDSFKW